jgi:hypothetical protein
MMTSSNNSPRYLPAFPSFQLCVALVSVLTIVRLIGLHYSIVDFYVDEAQYWAWSREFAFGYFSKPPLLAWIIAAAEKVCGGSEACVRAPAPIFYLGTSLLGYAIADELYDKRTAFWTALSIALAMGLVFSSRIISTDVPLLFFWSLALLAYVKLLRKENFAWAVVLGGALGLGLLVKYAMIYFLLGIALAACFDRDARLFLRQPACWLALAIAALCLAPNILWNMNNGFVTFKHTGDNIEGPGVTFNVLKGLEFIASQFAVFGPIVFGALLTLIVRFMRPDMPRADRLMLAFAIPVLALITTVAFITHAHANWAAPAFISSAIVVTAALVRMQAWRWLTLSLAIGGVVQVVLLGTDAIADRVQAPFLAKSDVYARTMGWRALGDEAGRIADRIGAGAFAGDTRDSVASLLYYQRNGQRPVLAWSARITPGNHFELTRPLTAAAPEPILFISSCPSETRLSAAYRGVEALGSFTVPTGPTSKRGFHAFKLSGVRGPVGPLARCG